jgi:predicted RNA polymerase sigma factor
MSRLREDHDAVRDRVAQVTRDSYGRLLAVLAAPTRDIAAAEDALADALERALARGPTTAYPSIPKAGCSPWRATDYVMYGSRPAIG